MTIWTHTIILYNSQGAGPWIVGLREAGGQSQAFGCNPEVQKPHISPDVSQALPSFVLVRCNACRRFDTSILLRRVKRLMLSLYRLCLTLPIEPSSLLFAYLHAYLISKRPASCTDDPHPRHRRSRYVISRSGEGERIRRLFLSSWRTRVRRTPKSLTYTVAAQEKRHVVSRSRFE